jgi:pimeloyl-ACP methyl ester carboxylesterase
MNEGLLDLQGMPIHYREAGRQGGAVVFIHGWASSSRMWLGVMEALAGERRCVALDLPGHGQSAKPAVGWYSLPNFVSVTYGLAAALQACPATLVGHSLGGTIALEYALRYPQDVERLVLVNPVVTGRLQFNLHWLTRRMPGRALMTLARRLWPRLATRIQQGLVQDRLRLAPEGYARRNLEDLTLASVDALLGSARAARHDLSPCLDGIRAPTLVVVGSRDLTVPPEEGRRAARKIPGARLVELPTDHHPGDETPDEFVSALRGFLEEASPRGG